MLNYYVLIAEVKDNYIGKKYGIINYESEASAIDEVEQIELIKGIIKELNEKLKQIFPDADNYVITELMPTHVYLEKTNRTNEELYKLSKDNWEKTMQSDDVQIRRLKKSYGDFINSVREIVGLTEHYNLQDSQEYLDFLDNLNKVSVSH